MSNRPYDARYEPRPGEQAAGEELRYRRFLDALGRAGLGSAERTERCTVAVLRHLEARLTGPEARDLKKELPWALRDRLRGEERHPRSRPERFGRTELVERVAEEIGVDPLEAERITRAVFAVTRSVLSEKEASDVQAQLPPDLAALWAPPS